MMTAGGFLLQLLGAAVLALGLLYLPGRLLLRVLKLNLNPLEELANAWVAGMGLLALFYWFFSLLGFPWLVWIYALAAAGTELALTVVFRRTWRLEPADPDVKRPQTLADYWPLGLLLLAGLIVQGRFTVATGWIGAAGASLMAWHGHDAPWHIYNIFQLGRGFPPEMPGFADSTLRNYHLLGSLVWGAFRRFLPLDPWHIYFRFAPLLYSALLTLSVFAAAQRWSGRRPVAYLAAAITLFCSNFGYFMPLLFGPGRYFYWDAIFWVQSPVTMIFNPGVSASFPFVLLGLWALIGWLRTREWRWLPLLVLYWGVLPGFKVYPGLLVMGALLAAGAWRWGFNRDWRLLLAWAAILPVFLAVFLPPNLGAPSLVRFLPGFNVASMLVAPDRMALMSSATLKLLYAQYPWLTALLLAVLALVFLAGNLGVRVLGLLPLAEVLRRPRKAEPVLLFMLLLVLAAWAAPLLFVQQGVQWNTIQFFYYAGLITALPAASALWSWMARLRRPWHLVLAGLFFALGAPGLIQAWIVIGFKEDVPKPLVEALLWLRREIKPGEVILRPLPNALLTDEGYRQWLRNQERGAMTSLEVWDAEASAMAKGDLPRPGQVPAPADAAQPVLTVTAVPTAAPTVAPAEVLTAVPAPADIERQLADLTQQAADAQARQERLERELTQARQDLAAAQAAEQTARRQVEALKSAAPLEPAPSQPEPGEALPSEPAPAEAAPEPAVGVPAPAGEPAPVGPEPASAVPESLAGTPSAGSDAEVTAEPTPVPEPPKPTPLQAATSRLQEISQARQKAQARVETLERQRRSAGRQVEKVQAKMDALRNPRPFQTVPAAATPTVLAARPAPVAQPTEVAETPRVPAGPAPAPAPLPSGRYLWPDSALVASLTFANTYLEDTVSAQIMGHPVRERAAAVRFFYLSANVVEARDFLEKARITYVILDADQRFPFDPAGVPLKPVFSNGAVTIYKYIYARGW